MKTISTITVSLLTLFVASSVPSQGLANRSYPLFKQCDSRWGNDKMGVNGPGERNTICHEGCAMTSLSMALNGLGVQMNNVPITPGTFNTWLEANHGYQCAAGDCNNLVLNAVEGLTSRVTFVSEAPKPRASVLSQMLVLGTHIYIAHVHHNGHFVLLTAYDPTDDSFYVNDPFYQVEKYPYANITDVITYTINPVASEEDEYRGIVVPHKYPLYKQCDSRWGNNIMETTTICAVGCLMSSTSMAIGGKHISIAGSTSNPGVLNNWLRNHNGYTGGNDMIESQVPKIAPSHISWPGDAMHPTNDVPLNKIKEMLKAGRPVIANVMQGRHFILVTGWNSTYPDQLRVNDPGFARDFYSYKYDVVGWRLFDMSAEKDSTESSDPVLYRNKYQQAMPNYLRGNNA